MLFAAKYDAVLGSPVLRWKPRLYWMKQRIHQDKEGAKDKLFNSQKRLETKEPIRDLLSVLLTIIAG